MKRTKIILLHILLWLLVFFTFFNIMNALGGFPKKAGYNPYLDFELYARAISTTIMLSIPFYFGYIVTPYLFKRQKRKLVVAIAVAFGIFFPIAMSIMDDGFRQSAILQSVFLFAFLNIFMILGISFRSLFGWIEQKRLHDLLEKQNLKSELALLRMQLNPHFLFNTIHNIDTLIAIDQKKASLSLVKLSDIMRYMLRDANSETVPLQKELEHIKNYISLEKLRLKNEKFLDFTTSGSCKGIRIAPMLLIPFIENAFKHSIDSSCENGIRIHISIQGKMLTFNCENKIEKTDSVLETNNGIGLETVKKRLSLIYPDKYVLEIQNSGSIYKVILEIDLNEN